MRRIPAIFGVAAAMLFCVTAMRSQTPALPPAPVFASLPPIHFSTAGPVIQAQTEMLKPFTVAGENGVLLGQQDGTFEAWVLPVKLLSHFTIEADVEGYGVPIDVNREAAEIEVRPDRTVITYSHPALTVRQVMFSPNEGPAGTGAVVVFEFDCLRPTDFTFRFTPELKWMWPERNEGSPYPDWETRGGFYVLSGDYPDLAAAIAMPGAKPGILAPYQERPQVHPAELKLHFDPARDRDRLFPLLMAVGTTPASATTQALGAKLEALNSGIAGSYQSEADEYKKLLADSVSIETPDKALNEDFQWAVVSIEQLRARAWNPNPAEPPETGLVAGYYTSADSARPGFGWFFGRDSLYTIYAIDSYGDFALSKAELEFLIRRQRADGKIMHEYSQTAPAVDWAAFPYEYAAADSTPLFLMATADYVRASGDVAFLTQYREAIEKAWAFETDPAHDTDHDGIYDNSQGTGWVEGWPGGLPHQEIYLALLDQQASDAIGYIEDLLHSADKAAAAKQRADAIAKTIEKEYYDAEKGCYAFSHDVDKNGAVTTDHTTTVYPALAWWDPAATSGKSGSGSILAHPEECLKQFAADALNTDWGLRDVANTEKIYDGLSYHQGSVWPLFTGWAALAEYRGGQPLAGYQLLMENANLTKAQDLGSVTELLSGDFFVPFGRSTSHQLWSSAMVITPILRGLFGISIDAQTKTITVNPHLPAVWNKAAIRNIQVPGGSFDLGFRRDGENLRFNISGKLEHDWRLRSDAPGARVDKDQDNGLIVPLPAVELGDANPDSPLPGARTSKFRVVSEAWEANKVTITAEGLAGSTANFAVRRHKFVKMRMEVGGGLSNQADGDHPGVSLSATDAFLRDVNVPFMMQFHFPPGDGWKTITATLTW